MYPRGDCFSAGLSFMATAFLQPGTNIQCAQMNACGGSGADKTALGQCIPPSPRTAHTSPHAPRVGERLGTEWCGECTSWTTLSREQSCQVLTMISSSRSGDSTRGMMTWLRSSGVFSCFNTLFSVFSCPESSAKLSSTEGLEGKREGRPGKGHGRQVQHIPRARSGHHLLGSKRLTTPLFQGRGGHWYCGNPNPEAESSGQSLMHECETNPTLCTKPGEHGAGLFSVLLEGERRKSAWVLQVTHRPDVFLITVAPPTQPVG